MSYPSPAATLNINTGPSTTTGTEGVATNQFLVCVDLVGVGTTTSTEADVRVTLTIMSGGGKAGTCSYLAIVYNSYNISNLSKLCIIYQYFRYAGYNFESSHNDLYCPNQHNNSSSRMQTV